MLQSGLNTIADVHPQQRDAMAAEQLCTAAMALHHHLLCSSARLYWGNYLEQGIAAFSVRVPLLRIVYADSAAAAVERESCAGLLPACTLLGRCYAVTVATGDSFDGVGILTCLPENRNK